MGAHVVTTTVTVGGFTFRKGETVHLTAAQEGASFISAQTRAVTFRDTTGETVGVSN
jgi:hypothetical protein